MKEPTVAEVWYAAALFAGLTIYTISLGLWVTLRWSLKWTR